MSGASGSLGSSGSSGTSCTLIFYHINNVFREAGLNLLAAAAQGSSLCHAGPVRPNSHGVCIGAVRRKGLGGAGGGSLGSEIPNHQKGANHLLGHQGGKGVRGNTRVQLISPSRDLKCVNCYIHDQRTRSETHFVTIKHCRRC